MSDPETVDNILLVLERCAPMIRQYLGPDKEEVVMKLKLLSSEFRIASDQVDVAKPVDSLKSLTDEHIKGIAVLLATMVKLRGMGNTDDEVHAAQMYTAIDAFIHTL
jgi:hypothetical protein